MISVEPTYSICLLDSELYELTGKRRSSAQIAALQTMGIEYKQRPDGRPAVLRAHVEEQMGCRSATIRAHRSQQPDFSNIN